MRTMKCRIALLAVAGTVTAGPHSFSVTDDILAYPQYEVIFSDSYVSHEDALSRLSSSAASFSTDTAAADGGAPESSIVSVASVASRGDGQDGQHSGADGSTADSSHDPYSSQQEQRPPSYEKLILDSTPYLCTIPPPPPDADTRNSSASTRTADEEAAELARATDRGFDLLQEMSGSCLYFISGWWSYQFCYSQSVKQFHPLPPGRNVPIYPPIEDPNTPSYVLGRFGEKRVNHHRLASSEIDSAESAENADGSSSSDVAAQAEDKHGSTTTIQAKGSASSRYLSQRLSGGTLCDLTGDPRRVEVQFHCHPQSADRIGWIKEVSTCSYLMVVYTPRLCNDVAFLPPREEKALPVICQEIIPADEAAQQEWHHRKGEEATQKLMGGDILTGKTTVGGKAAAQADAMSVRRAKAAAAAAEAAASSASEAGASQHESAESAAKAAAAAAIAVKPMVGNIEVGGMHLVGGERGWLSSVPPGGARPQHHPPPQQQQQQHHQRQSDGAPRGDGGQGDLEDEETQPVAHQHRREDGGAVHTISEAEMRDLGVDVKLVKQAIDELTEVAEGRGWRLEVYQNEEGKREMRGVIDGDDNPDGGDGESSQGGGGHGGGEEEQVLIVDDNYDDDGSGDTGGDGSESDAQGQEREQAQADSAGQAPPPPQQEQQQQQDHAESEAGAEGTEEDYRDEL